MPIQELYHALKETKLPVAYHHFEEGHSPPPPFMVYLVTDSDNRGADNWAYYKQVNLQIELYTSKKDLETETKVEAVLDAHLMYFDKVETYIASEKLYQINYHITLYGG
ncbi:hypothetical protein [Streptococcus sciuri]|uniref:Prophage pi2 protein 38 n=1 Tax=Streptococcus sciuri TaxID=2973939 RepID=A0ABT2F571_9STRE|nr:hypothetical protein [Streptococcus sciuri]MCS4487535.1 hypothetical protein [Streptococcus sciuri]